MMSLYSSGLFFPRRQACFCFAKPRATSYRRNQHCFLNCTSVFFVVFTSDTVFIFCCMELIRVMRSWFPSVVVLLEYVLGSDFRPVNKCFRAGTLSSAAA